MRATPKPARSDRRRVLAAIGLILASCAASPKNESERAEPGPLEHSLKGWEIYLLHSRCLGTWSFAILPGTNRLKTPVEIWNAARTCEDLLLESARLPAGERVCWRSFPSQGQTPERPPPLLIEQIEGALLGRGVTRIGSPGLAGVR